MWEVSSAGPLTGAAVSALLLGAGLWQSHGVDANAVNDLMVGEAETLGGVVWGTAGLWQSRGVDGNAVDVGG
eukprot:377895-Pelagomonas_calceolata.AAC.2